MARIADFQSAEEGSKPSSSTKLNLAAGKAVLDKLMKEQWFVDWCKEMAKK